MFPYLISCHQNCSIQIITQKIKRSRNQRDFLSLLVMEVKNKLNPEFYKRS